MKNIQHDSGFSEIYSISNHIEKCSLYFKHASNQAYDQFHRLPDKYLTRVLRRINHATTEKSDNGSIELDGPGAKSNSERFSQGHSPSLPMPQRQVTEHIPVTMK